MTAPLKVLLMDLWSIVPYYTCALYKALEKQNVQITLGSISYDLDPECFSRSGVRNNPGLIDVVGRYRFPGHALRRGLKLLEGCMNLVLLAIRFLFSRPDIVHVHQLRLYESGLPMEWWFLRYAQKLGVRLVYTVHNLLPHDTGDRQRDRFIKLYRNMDALVCHSSEVAQALAGLGVSPDRIWVIPHGPLFGEHAGASPDDATGRPASAPCIVLFHGILRPYKGISFLLRSWRVVEERCGDRVTLVIAGMGEAGYQAELERLASELQLKSVRFVFRFLAVPEMMETLAGADILVYPYREITSSGALMTGVVQGKPIVASDLPAFRSVLSEGRGVLVPYGDEKALAESLVHLVRQPEERGRLAEKLGCFAADLQRDAWTGIARQTRLCYEKLIRGPEITHS